MSEWKPKGLNSYSSNIQSLYINEGERSLTKLALNHPNHQLKSELRLDE